MFSGSYKLDCRILLTLIRNILRDQPLGISDTEKYVSLVKSFLESVRSFLIVTIPIPGLIKLKLFFQITHLKLIKPYCRETGRGSSDGTATRYRLDGPEIESRWGERDFPYLPRPTVGPTLAPIQWVPGLSRE
jgi:hypothetical protein